MFGLFGSNEKYSIHADTFTNTVPILGDKEIRDNSDSIESEFAKKGVEFDEDRLVDVLSSLFSTLIIDNFRRRDYYKEEEKHIDYFKSNVDPKYLRVASIDYDFKSSIEEREALANESAAWAAKKYLEIERKPTMEEASLFFERAATFVEFIDHYDEDEF